MDEQKNNIRVLFTLKANSALADIMKSFKLEETPEESIKRARNGKLSKIVVIDHLSKDFAIEKISGKDLINSLQKDLEVSQQTAEQISKEILTKIIPFIEKVPEEKFKDSAFVEEITKKVFGETIKEKPLISKIETPGQEPFGTAQGKKDIDIFPKIKPEEIIAKPIEKNIPMSEEKTRGKNTLPPKKQEGIKKPVSLEKIEEPVPQIKQPRGPDSYREPIG